MWYHVCDRVGSQVRQAVADERYDEAHDLNQELHGLKEKAPVDCRLVLAMKISQIPEYSPQRREFVLRFAADIAQVWMMGRGGVVLISRLLWVRVHGGWLVLCCAAAVIASLAADAVLPNGGRCVA